MRNYEREGVQSETAHKALRESYRNDDLAKLVKDFGDAKSPPTRKDDMLAALTRLLEGEQLQLFWAKLTSRERAMVAQTTWSDTGFFDREQFRVVLAVTGLVAAAPGA